jgi:hypothetical protein
MTPRIPWVDEASAEGRVAAAYAGLALPDGHVPDIMKTFSGRPEAIEGAALLVAIHFGPGGALSRAQRDMIAAHVSALLSCHY